LPESTFDAAQLVAERIQKNVREYHFNPPESLLSLTVSIGISSLPDPKGDIDCARLIEKTDQALRSAKSLGKNGCITNLA